MRRFMIALLVLMLAVPAFARPHDATIPLDHGQLELSDLSQSLNHHLHLPQFGSVDLHSLKGALLIDALNSSLGDGCRIRVTDDVLSIHFDTEKLPHDLDQAKHATRVFTAVAAPKATAAQAVHYGLQLPRHVDPVKPLTILVHGLDTDCSDFASLADLLQHNGQQTACFNYPNDQPLADSTALLTQHLIAFHEKFPDVPINIIAHSMGSLVARASIEGDSYPGGVQHLILVAPPNHGSSYAPLRFALEVREHYYLWKNNPDWSPTWMITDGLGEAGRDLHPDSAFLRELNSLTRRDGVHYTILAGDLNPMYSRAANVVDSVSHVLPKGTRVWFYKEADALRDHHSKSDGPVTLASTQLPGVSDYVVLHADHNSLCTPSGTELPAGWPVILDRLSH